MYLYMYTAFLVSHVQLHCVYVFCSISSDSNKAFQIAVIRPKKVARNSAHALADLQNPHRLNSARPSLADRVVVLSDNKRPALSVRS